VHPAQSVASFYPVILASFLAGDNIPLSNLARWKLCENKPSHQRRNGMQINYILNRIQKHNGFVYGQARLKKKRTQMIMEIEIRSRQNSHPICSGCEKKGPGYDTLPV